MYKNTLVVKGVALAASFMMLVSPIASIAAAPQTTVTVAIQNNTFTPRNITVQVGSVVTWKNWDSNMPHTVTSDTGLFNSGSLQYGDTYSIQFNGPGTYNYYCQFHGGPNGVGMSGTVTVINGTPPPPTGNVLQGTVTAPTQILVINSITPIKTAGSADDSFQNGWSWLFDISAPQNETNLQMKFDNWLRNGGGGVIPAGSNMRFYSTQSSNASTQNTAIYITAANVYSNSMVLTGDLDSGPMRRVQIMVEVKIPTGTAQGVYGTNFGIRTQ